MRTTEDSRKVLLQEVDESVGGRVVGADGRVVLQLWLDLLGQLLPQFNASGGNRNFVKHRCSGLNAASCVGQRHSPPLIVAVDVPDDPLNKDLVLVHG